MKFTLNQRILEQQYHRWLGLILLGLVIAGLSVLVAKGLILLIFLTTNLFYFQRFSFEDVAPATHQMGWLSAFVPAVGGLIVGLMAKYGSPAIRGHGIPEAMENILTKESRIPKRLTFLKPISAAFAIGSGGPFGAEGPIIATGSSLGSLLGQKIPLTAQERKVLVASGAAAGMTAIFGTPFSAVLLAVELLLFEFRARSFVPVAFACAFAAVLRQFVFPVKPFFEMPLIQTPSLSAFLVYILFGAIVGVAAVALTKAVYGLEDLFDHLPIHWMWWPALAGLAVGLIGLIEPRSLGVGYSNITDALNGKFVLITAVSLLFWKSLSWLIALSSGTSGGTLAPLMTIGSCLGFLCSEFMTTYFPSFEVSPSVMALIGMAGIFAGASRALLASAVFALEASQQPLGMVPLLAACGMSYLVSVMLMENSIMTEKIIRRGVHVPDEYVPKAKEPAPSKSSSSVAL